MTVTLYTRFPWSAYSAGSEALVAYLGLDVKIEYVSGKGDPPQLFTQLFDDQNRFTPSLYDSERDLKLNQAIAVDMYLISLAADPKGLLGESQAEYCEILQWTNRADGDIWRHLIPVMWTKVLGGTMTQAELETFLAKTDRGFELFEKHLQKHEFLVGGHITLADVYAASLISVGFMNVMTLKWQEDHPAVVRWANAVLNSDALAGKFHHQFKFGTGEAAKLFAK